MVLDRRSREIVRKKFAALRDKVTLLYLHDEDEDECMYCRATKEFLEELVELSDGKLEIKTFIKGRDENISDIFGTERAPVILFQDYKIRYLGAPVGQETWAFLETIIMASRKTPKLSVESYNILKKLNSPTRIEVIVTPSCPYCPYAALLSNSAAIASQLIFSDVVEAYEFPEIAEKYGVTAVPAIAINGKRVFVGVPPEETFIAAVKGEYMPVEEEYEHVGLDEHGHHHH